MPIVKRLFCELVMAYGAIAVALLSIHFAGAAELPLLPGIGRVDRRVAVDPRQPPWDAVAKVQTNIGTRCTGALIAPDIVLTAAHCLYNRRTRTLLQAGSLHVLFGYSRGNYRWHRAVAGYTTGSGFEGRDIGLQRSDWALLTLADPVSSEIAPLGLMTQPLLPRAEIMLAGYNQDRAQVLMADTVCHVTGAAPAEPFIVDDCEATRGTSGGPLLTRLGRRWAVAGINIAATPQGNVALPASAFVSASRR